MDFWELSKILLRRWLIFAPLLALTVAAAVLSSARVQATYSAQASVILLPPLTSSGTNAYVSLGIPTTAQSLAVASSDVGLQQTLRREGLSSDVSIASDRRSALLTLAAEAPTPEAAVSTVTRLVQLLEQRLVQQQDEVAASPNARITLQSLTPTIVPVPVTEGATRLAAVVLAVGLTVATAAALAVEGLARRRAARGRSGRGPVAPSDGADPGAGEGGAVDRFDPRLLSDPLVEEDPRGRRTTSPADAWS